MKKDNLSNSELCRSGEIQSENQRKSKERQVLRPCKRCKKNKLWNMKVTVIPIVTGALGTVPKGWLRELIASEIGGRIETIQTAASLRSARQMRRVLKTWRDLLSLRLQWKTISWRWSEKLTRFNNNNNNKYLDLARELKKLWNMKVTIVLIVIGAFGTITKGLLKGLEDLEVGGRVETIQMTA